MDLKLIFLIVFAILLIVVVTFANIQLNAMVRKTILSGDSRENINKSSKKQDDIAELKQEIENIKERLDKLENK